jgi:4-hydroxythreonine-4-phosphate dehydrogenase
VKQILGITAGDPAGIGAEIIVKALADKKPPDTPGRPEWIPLVIGDKTVLEDALALTALPLKLRCVHRPEEAVNEAGTINLLDMRLLESRGKGWDYGAVSAPAGNAAFRYVEKAAALAGEKRIAGIVTAPINKEAINLTGHRYPGHTEILAALTGTADYAMLLTCDTLRVIHVTSHVALKAAADLITIPRVLSVIRLAGEGLKLLGYGEPRIAVAGFNPHASENGLFGDEEKRVIIPAVEAARAAGIQAEGPLPPDTVFVKALGKQYDVVVAMYHDQGHIPLKLAGFKLDPASGQFTRMSGVNCTLGLPIIRTSVDHGTAFDRAGKNCSNEQSMVEAIAAALTMAKNLFPGDP